MINKNFPMFAMTETQLFNLDDDSSQFIPIAQYDLDDHLQAYFVGTLNFGDRDAEFKLFRDNSYFFGLQYTF